MQDLPIMDSSLGTCICDEEVIVLKMNRCPARMWEELWAQPDLRQCSKGMYVPEHLRKPIVQHMVTHGVYMMTMGQHIRFKKDDTSSPGCLLVTQTFLPSVQQALKRVPSRRRAIARHRGRFVISVSLAIPWQARILDKLWHSYCNMSERVVLSLAQSVSLDHIDVLDA